MRSQGDGSSSSCVAVVDAALGTAEGGGPIAPETESKTGRKAPAVTERITHTTVTFRHPFELPGMEGEQSAGTYTVETTEEPIGGLSLLAYRRVSTTIILASREFGPASRQVVTIEPLDLDAALKRDAARGGYRSARTVLARRDVVLRTLAGPGRCRRRS